MSKIINEMSIVGEPVKKDAALMCVNIRSFNIAQMRDKEAAMRQLGRIIELIDEVVTFHHGCIARISEAQLTAFFDSGCEEAVRAAVTICEQMESTTGKCDIQIGVGYGLICISNFSVDSYNLPIIMSDILDTIKKISKNAAAYKSHIIVSEPVAEHIANFKLRFNSRCLGKVKITANDTDMYVYDVYDGDERKLKYSKRRSRLFFETGVEQFMQGNYMQARSYFIELLKLDVNDTASKKYVHMCDELISHGEQSGMERYIEVF